VFRKAEAMSDDVTDGYQTYEDAVQAQLDAKNEQIADYRQTTDRERRGIAQLKFEHEEMTEFFRKWGLIILTKRKVRLRWTTRCETRQKWQKRSA
jgi:hypothetical protein